MKKRSSILHSGCFLALLIGLLLAGSCPPLAAAAGTPAAPQSTSGTLTIGVMGPLTGGVSFFGKWEQDGVTLAVEQQNARGGLLGQQVGIKSYDTQCGATATEAARQAIVQDGLRYVIGDVCSAGSLPVAEVANAHGALQVTPTSTAPIVTVDENEVTRPYTFRACFVDPFQARAAAKFAQETLGVQKAFVLYTPDSGYSQGLAAAFLAEAGSHGLTVQSATYRSADTDFSQQLSQIAAMNPDLVYLGDFYNVANLVAGQARQKGLTMPFMGGDGWDSPSLDYVALDGSYYTNHFSPEDTCPGVQTFDQQFLDRFGYPANAISALSYDAANLLFQAIQAAGTLDASVVKDRMAGIVLHGVTGVGPFDAFHNPIKSVVVMKVTSTGMGKPGAHFYTDSSMVAPISMGPQAMEGDLKLNPGSNLKVGYDFTMPGSHPAANVTFVSARVVFAYTCVAGAGSGNFLVTIPDSSYGDQQNSSAWYPSGDQHSPLVYQGSLGVPDVCNGGQVRLQRGGTFTAGVASSDQVDKVNVRWHYSANGSAGGWSGTQSIVPTDNVCHR